MRTTVTVRTHNDGRKLQSTPFVHDFAVDDGHYVFSVDRNELDRAMAQLTDLGIIDLTVTPASLEDMFLREYQGAGSMSTATAGSARGGTRRRPRLRRSPASAA